MASFSLSSTIWKASGASARPAFTRSARFFRTLSLGMAFLACRGTCVSTWPPPGRPGPASPGGPTGPTGVRCPGQVLSPREPRRPCPHLLDGHDGLVLGALGALVQHGAEAQPVGGHPQVLLVEALAVQQRGLLQVLHGRLQPVLVLLDERHLHVHLAAQQDHEAAGGSGPGPAEPAAPGSPEAPPGARAGLCGPPAAQLATAAGPWAPSSTSCREGHPGGGHVASDSPPHL